MHPYCEIAVKEILPAFRSLIAQEMLKNSWSQAKIAETMEITQPAVSHYLRENRALQVEMIKNNKHVYDMIKETAKGIMNGNKDPDQFCVVCKEVRRQGIICSKCSSMQNCDKCLPNAGYR